MQALALIGAMFVAVVVFVVGGVRLMRFFFTTKAGWFTMAVLALIALWYMATHEPPWNTYL